MGRSVGKIIIIIILSFRLGTFKIKNIDLRGKKTYAMFGLPIQNRIVTFLVKLVELKERACIRRKINS